MSYILAFDQGTSSSRSILFDSTGKVVASAQEEFTQYYPQDGWVEHDAEEIWSTQLNTARKVLELAAIDLSEIQAIGITNQRETLVVWNKETGQLIHKAIVWQDRRTKEFIDSLQEAGHEEMVQKKTGLILDPYFSASKLRWILDNDSHARELAEAGALCAGTVDSWLIYKLTGGREFVTDHTNASRTLLFNIHELDWDEELLELFEVPRSILPQVQASASHFGNCHREVFGREIPILGVAGDQQAALFGQNCLSPGMGKNTYGTGCFLLMNTGEQAVTSSCRLLTTIACSVEGEAINYALEGSVFIAGAAINWLRDGLGIIKEAAEITRVAASVEDAGGLHFVPALVGLGAPYWNSTARGMLTGIQRNTNRGHVCRAVLEGVAWSVADVIQAMEKDSGYAISKLRVDGGAAASDLLLQLQADFIQAEVHRVKSLEQTALGVACLAGLKSGLWQKNELPNQSVDIDQVFSPQIDQSKQEQLRAGWNQVMRKALHE